MASLERKLGADRARVTLLDGAPDGFALEAATTRRLPRTIGLGLTFHSRADVLERLLRVLEPRLETDGALWVCWPKRTAQAALGIDSDLGDGVVREIGLATGLVDVKVCAVDDTWSGLKLVRRLRDRERR